MPRKREAGHPTPSVAPGFTSAPLRGCSVLLCAKPGTRFHRSLPASLPHPTRTRLVPLVCPALSDPLNPNPSIGLRHVGSKREKARGRAPDIRLGGPCLTSAPFGGAA